MVAPRIFISHSAKSDEEIQVLWSLHDRLDAEGFEVLLDVARLEEDLGGPWRSTLNTWIEICHSAVLVFNQRAATESDWVAYEGGLLAWRRQRDPEFVLVPVVIPPANPSDLSRGRFEPHMIGEGQAIMSDSLDWLDNVVNALKPVLERLKTVSPAPSPAALVEERLTTLLHEVNDNNAILRAAVRLGVDLSCWQPNLDRRRALARLLLQADLLKACQAAKELSNLDQMQLVRIREYLAPGWVSCQAVYPIKETSLGQSSERLLAINAGDVDTFKMYLHRATGESEERSWPSHEEMPFTSRAASEIVNSIRKGFSVRLGVPARRLDSRLNDPKKSMPIFVLLAGQEPERTEINAVRDHLRAVTFFMTAQEGKSIDGKTTRSGARLLLPVLESDAEEVALERYDLACEEIRNP